MLRLIAKWSVCALGFTGVLFFNSGCMTGGAVMRDQTPYSFVKKDSALGRHYKEMYHDFDVNKINLEIVKPSGKEIVFSKAKPIAIDSSESDVVKLGPGAYTFNVRDPETKKSEFVGCIMVYNVDKKLALATLGKSDETLMFDPQLLSDLKKGVLGHYTMQFDDKPVLTYWVGNRSPLALGDKNNAEVDFSGSYMIEQLRINGRKVYGYKKKLPITQRIWSQSHGRPIDKNVEYSFDLTSDGKEYTGYLKIMSPNEYTSFMRIPCSIPSRLLRAADKGTVAKFIVRTEGEEVSELAEILLSRKLEN